MQMMFFLLTPLFLLDYLFTILQYSLLPSQCLSPSVWEAFYFIQHATFIQCRIAFVPSVESSSREEKHSPCIGSFSFGNKSKSDGIMSGL